MNVKFGSGNARICSSTIRDHIVHNQAIRYAIFRDTCRVPDDVTIGICKVIIVVALSVLAYLNPDGSACVLKRQQAPRHHHRTVLTHDRVLIGVDGAGL